MKNIKLLIEYNGTNYCGWQKQKNGLSIQEVISSAIFTVTGEKVALNGSGRTDSGVHAVGQVASFKTKSSIPPERFYFAINSVLPADISIVSSEEVPQDFHARFSVASKTYRYYIWCSERRNAIIPEFAHFVPNQLDLNLLNEAAKLFLGTHDFRGFMASGSKVESTVREVFNANVFEVDPPFATSAGKMLCFEITGSGFLYNMVRIIAGTLMEVGLGRRTLQEVSVAIESGSRKLAGQTLPANGLFLYKVFYNES